MRWSFILLLVCSSCHSKPVVQEPAHSILSKVTAETTDEPIVQFFVKVAYGPRRIQEIDSAFSLNLATQNCFLGKGVGVTADIFGKVAYAGGLEAIVVKSQDKALAGCLQKAMESVSLGRGRIGPFKARLTTDPQAAEGAKGLNISPPPVKKFE